MACVRASWTRIADGMAFVKVYGKKVRTGFARSMYAGYR
jgi:hypothetical protein